MDKKLNICCKYYLPPYFLCLDVDILAFLVSTGLNCSWVSRCACYYPYAKMCSFCWFCLLIYSNSHFQRPASSLERKSGRITSSSIISMGTAGRLHTCDLALPGGFQLPRGFPTAALQPCNAVRGGGGDVLFPKHTAVSECWEEQVH